MSTDDGVVSNILNTVSPKKKTLKPKTKREQEQIDPSTINYSIYFEKKVNLSTLKIPQLKILVKKNKLPLTGSKPVLIGRLDSYFRQSIKAVFIQKLFRGFIVRKSIKLRGIALTNRSICHNHTDFVSMEPLIEIPMELFFSYTDSKSFTYGFNLSSIIQALKALKEREKMINPYNREKMEESVIQDAISLYKLSFIIYPHFKDDNEKYHQSGQQNFRNTYRPNNQPMPILFSHSSYNPTLNIPYLQIPENRVTYNRILEKRSLPIEQRINNLFMEMDRLGNYTQISWFTNLERNDYVRLYRAIYEIWYFRGELTYSLRNSICPFHEPFNAIFVRPLYNSNITLEQIKLGCLIVMENMVYSGTDLNFRQIGTFHALSGLTLVSPGAREAMPWLYESVVI